MLLTILLLSMLGLQESLAAEMKLNIVGELRVNGEHVNGMYDYRPRLKQVNVKTCEEVLQRLRSVESLKQVVFVCKGVCLAWHNGRIRVTTKMTVSSEVPRYICGQNNSIHTEVQKALTKKEFTYLGEPVAIVPFEGFGKRTKGVRAELQGVMYNEEGPLKYEEEPDGEMGNFNVITEACNEVKSGTGVPLVCADGEYINMNGHLGVLAKIDFGPPRPLTTAFCGGDRSWDDYFQGLVAEGKRSKRFESFKDFTVSVPFQ